MNKQDIFSLVSNLRDDQGGVLLKALEDLQSRVQAADLHNAGNSVSSVISGAVREARMGRASSMRSASFRSASMLRSPSLMKSASKRDPDLIRTLSRVSGSSTAGGISTHSFIDGVPHGTKPPAAQKIDDAKLPIPPAVQHAELTGYPSTSNQKAFFNHELGLAAPEGSHEWDALQSAVGEACAHFSSPAAKVAWKKWALNFKNVSLVVSLFWWVVSEVFKPDHALTLRGSIKEHAIHHFGRQYISAVVQYKGLNKDLYNDLWQQVLAAAVIFLLKDCFPRSEHRFNDELKAFISSFIRRLVSGTLPADSHPSLYSDPGQILPAAVAKKNQRQQQQEKKLLEMNPSNDENDFLIPPPPPPLDYDYDESSSNRARDISHLQAEDRGSGSTSFIPVSHTLGFSTLKPSPVMLREMQGHGLNDLRSGEAALKGSRTDKVGGRSQHALRRPLDAGPGDEVSFRQLAKACRANALEAVSRYEDHRRGVAKDVNEIRRDLVDQRTQIESKVAEIQRNTMVGDDYIPPPSAPTPVTAKALANRLSNYLENDIERLMRRGGWEVANAAAMQASAFPTSLKRSGPKAQESSSSASSLHLHPHLPTYLASTEANQGACHGSASNDMIETHGANGISTRIMAPWSRMRRCEEALSGALSQTKKNSHDVAARMASKKNLQPAKPARGSSDIKLRRKAGMIIHGLDLEK